MTLAFQVGFGQGVYEVQDSSGASLFQLNATARPTNSNEFLKPSIALESAGGGTRQWQTGDGLPAGGALMFQVRDSWHGAEEEAALLGQLMSSMPLAAYLADMESGNRCAIFAGTEWSVMPVRTERKYGALLEINILIEPVDKAEAGRLLRGGP